MDKTKTNICILHGWGHNAAYWENFKNILEASYNVYIFDLPGFGVEKLGGHNWGVPEYSHFVTEKIKSLNIAGPIILLGHSFGGRLGAYIASFKMLEIEALILTGVPLFYSPGNSTQLLKKIAPVAKKLSLDKLFKRAINPELHQADETGLGQVYRNVVGFDQTNYVIDINVPTLLVWGKKDTDAPVAQATKAKTLIKNCELQIFDNLGHNIYLENPHIFYGTIKNFLTSKNL